MRADRPVMSCQLEGQQHSAQRTYHVNADKDDYTAGSRTTLAPHARHD